MLICVDFGFSFGCFGFVTFGCLGLPVACLMLWFIGWFGLLCLIWLFYGIVLFVELWLVVLCLAWWLFGCLLLCC